MVGIKWWDYGSADQATDHSPTRWEGVPPGSGCGQRRPATALCPVPYVPRCASVPLARLQLVEGCSFAVMSQQA